MPRDIESLLSMSISFDFEVVTALCCEDEYPYQCVVVLKNKELVGRVSEILTKRGIVEVVGMHYHLHHFVIRDTVYCDCAALAVKIGAKHLSLLPQLPESVVRAEVTAIMDYIKSEE